MPRLTVTLIAFLCLATSAVAPLREAIAQVPNNDDPMIELTFSENVELKVVIDYVAKRLDMNVLYDEQVGNKLVTIKSPGPVPRSSLLGLLQSVLRMKGLVLVDADEPGWKRVVIVGEMGAYAKADKDPQSGARAVTQVFRLSNLDGKQAEQMVVPLLTRPGGNAIGIPRQPIVIVTDFASNMPRIEQVLSLIDEPRSGVVLRSYTVQHAALTELSRLVQELISARQKAEWGSSQDSGLQVTLTPVPHANRIVAVGVQQQVEEALRLLQDLDVPDRLITRAYQFQYTTPTQINDLVQGLLDPAMPQTKYRQVIDEDLGLLVVVTTEAIHSQIEALANDLDVAPLEDENPVRIYRLLNTEAADVLATIRTLESGVGFDNFLLAETGEGGTGVADSKQPGSSLTTTAVDRKSNSTSPPKRSSTDRILSNLDASGGALLPSGNVDVRVAVDEHTNSILVIAPPAEQKVYERLIELLDQRRPQVMIEAVIVTLDTSNGYTFGVEIAGSGSAGSLGGDYLVFSSFGLSEPDTSTGSLALIPGLGFNGTLLNSDVADVVIRALRTNGRATVMSAPRILVNDNTAGTLSSVAAEPYAAIVDSSNNTSTTTLGGNSEAGTTITVTPRISMDDYLQLEYNIELSNFTGDRSANLPPPSQRNTIQSDVTIPDGYTIVVGGINRIDNSNTESGIPVLSEIPVLKHLFSSQDVSHREQTLFVFIRPVILRDDRFADLKYLSGRDRDLAGLDSEYPSSESLSVY